MRVVTLDAVAHRRRMHCPFRLGGVFVGVAGQAQRLRSRSVISLIRVMSRLTRTSWQLRQPVAIAECTALPLLLSSWHSRHLAESTFLSSGTGWVLGENAGIPPVTKRKAASLQNLGRACRKPALPFRLCRSLPGDLGMLGPLPLYHLHDPRLPDADDPQIEDLAVCKLLQQRRFAELRQHTLQDFENPIELFQNGRSASLGR
jgi:hypothetical protein